MGTCYHLGCEKDGVVRPLHTIIILFSIFIKSLAEGVDTSNMKMSEISELREARRRALGAELIVADEAYRPTSKSDKGR